MAKNWIAGAVKNKGGLHKSLGVPQGQPISQERIMAAAKRSGKVGKEGRLAEVLAKVRKNVKGK